MPPLSTPNPLLIIFAFLIVIFIFQLFFLLLSIQLLGKGFVYHKAEKKAYLSLIPFYKNIVLLDIANLNRWFFVLFLLPFTSFVMKIIVKILLSKKFGHSFWFALGLVFFPPIFWLILGFNKSSYHK